MVATMVSFRASGDGLRPVGNSSSSPGVQQAPPPPRSLGGASGLQLRRGPGACSCPATRNKLHSGTPRKLPQRGKRKDYSPYKLTNAPGAAKLFLFEHHLEKRYPFFPRICSRTPQNTRTPRFFCNTHLLFYATCATCECMNVTKCTGLCNIQAKLTRFLASDTSNTAFSLLCKPERFL